MQGTLFGERGRSGAPRAHVAFPGVGRLEAITDEGHGYKLENEDAVAWAESPTGDVFLIDFDGMGGYAHGKEAAHCAATTMVELLSNGQDFDAAAQEVDGLIQQKFPEAGAAFVALQVTPATTAGQPHLAQVHWAGDARLLILRRNAGDEWAWIYRSSDDLWVKDIVDHEIDEGTKEARFRTQSISLHPMGNILTNGLGKAGYELNTTSSGEVPCDEPDSPGFKRADGLEAIELHHGDLVVLFSDGVADNYLKTQHLMNLLETAKNEKEAVERIYRESIYKMEVLQRARSSEALSAGERFSFSYKGQSPHLKGRKLWVDSQGKVWDEADEGAIVAKLKADNLSVMALQVDTGEASQSKTPGRWSLLGWLRSAMR